jgi:ABC-2 type transport system permease protein
VTGSVTGVTFGMMISSLVKGKEAVKMGILTGATMTMCFLSGMMFMEMKYIIETNVPFLSKINLVNLITDSFYVLYYYTDHVQYFTNTLILWSFCGVFCAVTYLIIRRQRYASL